MLMKQITNYLDKAHIDYQSDSHPTTYTAQEIAEQANVDGMSFAKTVMVIADDKLAMVVMPAPYTIDFDNIAQAMGVQKVELAFEYQFRNAFPDCETGAMPPFGNLFEIPVYAVDALVNQDMISFNAGNHRELLHMRSDDFKQLVQPTVISSGFHKGGFGHQHEHTRQGKLRH
jgi:Ala-tRNA(Pro) deacylase